MADVLKREVWVWDSNPFNPYGAEVARIVGGSGANVRRFCRKGDLIQSRQVRRSRIIPATSHGEHTLRVKAAHAIALLRFFVGALVFRPIVVYPWLETGYEQIVARTLQLCRVKTVLVVHNPVPGRDLAASNPRLRRLQSGAGALVVHSDALLGNLPRGTTGFVAEHPSYRAWRESRSADVSSETEPATTTGQMALYMGSVRPDKGFEYLPELADELSQHGVTLGLSLGRLDETQKRFVRDIPNAVMLSDGDSYVEDDDLFSHLARAKVLIAPYRNVTASGTVVLALTMGVDVVAFEATAFAGILPKDRMAPVGDARALARSAAAIPPRGNRHSRAEHLDVLSAHGWQEALAHVSTKTTR